MSQSNKLPNVDPRLKNISNSLYLDKDDNVTVRVSSGDFFLDLSGNNSSALQYSEFKNGVAPSVSQNSEVSIWNESTLYPWSSITTAQKIFISSSSASDTGQSIRIEGLDNTYHPISETIVTNGLTSVQSANSYLRLNRSYIISGSPNAGTIKMYYSASNGVVIGSMAIGNARNKSSIFTIPAGYTGYILYGDATPVSYTH